MSERDAITGRFLPGNAGGPGRAPRSVEEQYLQVMRESVTLDDWRTILAQALTDAKEGNANVRQKAREWLGKYLLPAINLIGMLEQDEKTLRVIFENEAATILDAQRHTTTTVVAQRTEAHNGNSHEYLPPVNGG